MSQRRSLPFSRSVSHLGSSYSCSALSFPVGSFLALISPERSRHATFGELPGIQRSVNRIASNGTSIERSLIRDGEQDASTKRFPRTGRRRNHCRRVHFRMPSRRRVAAEHKCGFAIGSQNERHQKGRFGRCRTGSATGAVAASRNRTGDAGVSHTLSASGHYRMAWCA